MKPAKIRRWIHDVYAGVAVALLITGGFLTFPDARAQLLKAYGYYIPDLHIWAGWLFIAIPIAGACYRGRENWDNLRRRMFHDRKIQWRQIHLSGTWVAGLTFAISGVVIWWEKGIPLFIVDAMFAIHLWLAWVFFFATLYHLIAARRAIIVRTKNFFKKQ